jgi:preprotein translocase subunit SecB
MTEKDKQAGTTDGPHLEIMRIYLKDVSFETPNSPQVFLQPFKPEVNLNLNTSVNKLEGDMYEVVLNVTVTNKQGENTAFLVEVQQAGIFTIRGYDETQKAAMLGAYCPNTLYPFVREAISDLVVKGGFPPLLLSPIDFNALYAEKMKQAQSRARSPDQATH